MNEKFLSRGKREDTGKWVEGYYVEFPEDQHGKKLCLIIGLDGQYNRIIPETAGRCAGITDKNGKMIFEGDIVIYGDTNNRYYGTYDVVFEQRGGSAYFGIKINDIETWQFCIEVHPKIMEVISNIHDPKLIDDIVENIAQPILKPATEHSENLQNFTDQHIPKGTGNELKPCPFCGGKATITHEKADTEDSFYLIECEDCGAAVSFVNSTDDGSRVWNCSKFEAITNWNRRSVK